MNRYNLLSLIALAAFVIALPIYAGNEARRMDFAQQSYRQQVVQSGAELYTKHCRLCHGDRGEGVAAMPPLNNPALAEINPDLLFRTIARAAHGSEMAAWHIDEGGMLNDLQLKELVDFIRFADWELAGALAQADGPLERLPTAYETGNAFLEVAPHECVSCHEDPPIHEGLFGLECERCHNTIAWTPAYLTRHTFFLDHGGQQGELACETCHVETYQTNTCYSCHDHTPEQMEDVHLAENIADYENCQECHPTGVAGEAARLREAQILGAAGVEVDASLARSLIGSNFPVQPLLDGGR
jgi:mono/diheme cytochrome c family protein